MGRSVPIELRACHHVFRVSAGPSVQCSQTSIGTRLARWQQMPVHPETPSVRVEVWWKLGLRSGRLGMEGACEGNFDPV